MFDGVPDQFHQFITPRTSSSSSSSLPIHLPFPLSTPNNTNTFPSYDPYNHQLPLQQPNLLQPILHQHHNKDIDDEHEKQQINTTNTTTPNSMNNQTLILPWTNDEVLALLKIRSNMENWFPDFTWEHVSRKLAEVGYKRSAEKCKEKFEEESRFFNNINHNQNNYGKNFQFVTELEELYQGGDNNNNQAESEKGLEKMCDEEEDSRNDDVSGTKKSEDKVFDESTKKDEKKRKRSSGDGDNRFEVFKGFCESVVKKMMEQQEEMHNKLIEDMVKRDEEKFSREEAWKKQEIEKMNKELEIMAHEQAIACDRQANIIEFLNKFSTQNLAIGKEVTLVKDSSTLHSQNPIKKVNVQPPKPSSKNPLASSSTSIVTHEFPHSNSLQLLTISSNERDDIGRRWPKDEVLALINLRCNSNNNEEKEGNNNKAPLWERISQGMLELGYKRSAKRCKEKWENINKYFRKTKDANRKRSLDSRTCPYFHLLSNLYNQGKLVLQCEKQESGSNLNVVEEENVVQEEQAPPQDENQGGGSGGVSSHEVVPTCW